MTIDGYRSKWARKDALEPEHFRSALLTFGPYDVSLDEVNGWSLSERAQIYDFVIDQHYRAGDHIVRKPRPRPSFFTAKECQ